MGNKVVLKGYTKKPTITTTDSKVIVAAGDDCNPEEPTDDGSSAFSNLATMAGLSIPFLMGGAKIPAATIAAAGLMAGMPAAQGQAVECASTAIEVEIYLDSTADEIVMRNAQSGDFETCPPESLYWEHHPSVYGGYKGCVGEKAYYPCPQDSQGIWEEGGNLYAQYPVNYVNGEW